MQNSVETALAHRARRRRRLQTPSVEVAPATSRPGHAHVHQQSRRARSRSTPRSMFVWRWNSHLCVLALSRAGGCWQQPALRRMAGAAVSFQPRPRRCGRWRQWRHRLTRWHVPAVCRSVCQNLCGATRVLAAIFVCSLSPDFCCAQWPRFPFKGSIDGSRVWGVMRMCRQGWLFLSVCLRGGRGAVGPIGRPRVYVWVERSSRSARVSELGRTWSGGCQDS